MKNDVRLREVVQSDLPIFFEHQMDADAIRMAAVVPRKKDAFMTHWENILSDESITKRTIVFDGKAVGYIACFERSGKREVGYWIGKEYWGKGIGGRALSAFLGEVTVRPLYAYVAKHNIASLRILQKCLFAVVGVEKEFFDAGDRMIEGFITKLG